MIILKSTDYDNNFLFDFNVNLPEIITLLYHVQGFQVSQWRLPHSFLTITTNSKHCKRNSQVKLTLSVQGFLTSPKIKGLFK